MADTLTQFVEDLKRPPPDLEPVALPEDPQYLVGNQRALKRVPPPERDERRTQPLAEFRTTIQNAMRQYVTEPEPDYMLLIPAPPGSGKTWAGVDFAHWVYEQTKRRVLYAGPRHDFFADVVNAAAQQGHDNGLWYEWLPRQKAQDEYGTGETCKHVEAINTWMYRGYKGIDFCERVCHWNYIKICPYHGQSDQSEPLIFGQHAHVVLGHSMAKQFAVVIGDEMPISSFIHEWLIPPKWILPKDFDLKQPLAEILHIMRKMTDEDMAVHGPALIHSLGGPDAVIDACELAWFPAEAVEAPTIYRADEADDQPFAHLPALTNLLRREAEAVRRGLDDYPERIWLRPSGLTLLLRRKVNEQMPPHIIWFDATGSQKIYEAMFERKVEVIDASPQFVGRIYQVTDRANGKRTMTNEKGNESRYAQELKTQIDAICERENASKPAVITFQQLEESIDQDTAHFYGSRGTNQFQDCDVLIVAGTPLPPLYQIEKYAKAIWHERMQPFNQTWLPVDRPYNYVDENGDGWAYPTSIFADYELNEILWQYREAEIIQAAHRARILFRDVPVYLLTNVPIDELPPTKLLSIRELMNAPKGVHVFNWQQVVETAERLDRKKDGITLVDLQVELSITEKTARKYRDLLMENHGWVLTKQRRKTGKRGPGSTVITKTPVKTIEI